jgi:hypothetical protein
MPSTPLRSSCAAALASETDVQAQADSTVLVAIAKLPGVAQAYPYYPRGLLARLKLAKKNCLLLLVNGIEAQGCFNFPGTDPLISNVPDHMELQCAFHLITCCQLSFF